MEIKVIKGYVSHNKKLYGVGTVLDLEDSGEAKRLIAAGIAASTKKAAVKEEAPAAAPKNADPAELPVVDPMASVQKGKKK